MAERNNLQDNMNCYPELRLLFLSRNFGDWSMNES